MNNNMFCLARYLRDLGHEADVFVTSTTMPHFSPTADSYTDDYKNFVFNVNWESLSADQRKMEVDRVVKNYDVVFGCGHVPAYMSEINKPLDMFLPYGGDISVMPNVYFSTSRLKKIFFENFKLLEKIYYSLSLKLTQNFRTRFFELEKAKDEYYLSRNQVNGIKQAHVTLLLETNEETEVYYRRIASSGTRLKITFPFIYAPMYSEESIQEHKTISSYYSQFLHIREKFKLVLFHHTRHQWKTSYEPTSWKGNDTLIYGFADFLKESNDYNACLIMFEYGADVLESKKLVKELNIDGNVFWFTTMSRKDIMVGLSMADIGCSEYAISWATGGTIFETLCVGKILFHYLEESKYEPDDVFPHVNIKSKRDVTQHLLNYIDNPQPYLDQAKEGQKWFSENVIQKPLEIINAEILKIHNSNRN